MVKMNKGGPEPGSPAQGFEKAVSLALAQANLGHCVLLYRDGAVLRVLGIADATDPIEEAACQVWGEILSEQIARPEVKERVNTAMIAAQEKT